MALQRTALWLIILALVLLLLIYAKALLIPLVVAICIWYLINTISSWLARLKIGSLHLPNWLTIALASAIIVIVLFGAIEIVIGSINSMIAKSESYDLRFHEILESLKSLFHLETFPSFAQILEQVNLNSILTSTASALTQVAGNLFLVVIYTLFLLLEQHTFKTKWRAIFPVKEDYMRTRYTLDRIHESIREYISVKTGVSLTTSILSYIMMMVVGLDFAIFWAFLIFLLNYIPTFGSLAATAFPVLFSILQFESWTPIAILFFGIMVIQITIGNLIEPRLLGRTLNISSLVVLISLTVWGTIWDVIGMVLAVPITVTLMIIMSEFDATRPVAVWLSGDGTPHTKDEKNKPED